MSGPNQMPSINKVRFIESQSGNDHIKNINQKREGYFELGMELVLGGLNLMEDENYPFQSFYINVATYTQVGQKEIIIHGVRSEKFNLKRVTNAVDGEEELYYYINKFRSDELNSMVYDFKYNIFWVEIFYTVNFINTEEELKKSLFGNSNLTLFRTKIPYSNVSKGD